MRRGKWATQEAVVPYKLGPFPVCEREAALAKRPWATQEVVEDPTLDDPLAEKLRRQKLIEDADLAAGAYTPSLFSST